jgi:sporadic carbohydrate cluster 2OG-Fe(II) oxygenase
LLGAVVDGAVSFLSEQERRVADDFLRDGCIVAPAEDRAALDRIRAFIAAAAAAFLGEPAPGDPHGYLDAIGERVDAERLNDLRLAIIDALAGADWFREAYFACGRRLLEVVAGNELAMQRGVGFSVQLPGDASSLLPLHSDVWSEDSPFEVVLWIPLVDCYRTKSMFVLPPAADERWRPRMHEFAGGSVDAFFTAVEPDLRWLEIPYGNVLVFTHTLMHGNRINDEPTARWSLNVRFKGLFTPYADKALGDFFAPITLRPASRIGMRYRLPGGFGDGAGS